MRKYLGITAAGCMLAALATAIPAQARVNQRQNHQQVRIAKGINNGSITAREAAGLQSQQVRIARYEARSRADGGGLIPKFIDPDSHGGFPRA